MRALAVILSLLLALPASAHDALLRANTLADAKAFLTFLGYTDVTLSTPYAQGQKGGVTYFLVFAGGGTGRLYSNTGTAQAPVWTTYDTGLWGMIRYNGDLGGFKLPSGIVCYQLDGKAVVASGGDNVTTVTDTVNATPQTPVQPPAAVILTSTGIM